MYCYVLHTGSIMRSRNYRKSYLDRRAAVDGLIACFKANSVYHRFEGELEYLAFQHMFFIPSKEIVLEAPKDRHLGKFREYICHRFPRAIKNHYIKEMLSPKDKLMLWLLWKRLYCVMRALSKMRKLADLIWRKPWIKH